MFALLAPLALSAVATGAGQCVATIRDVAAGEHLTVADLEAVACRDGSPSKVHIGFSAATRSAVAARPLPRGTYLGRLSAASAAILPKGSRVTLRAISGPAIIEREVVTLQAARSGQRVFVRDAKGQVFAVPLVMTEGAE